MSEKALEAKAGKAIKKLHGLFLKFVSPSLAGVPDRIILLPWRRIYFVEFKSETGKLSKMQIVVHGLFKLVGFPVYVISNDDELADFIRIVS